MPLSPRCTSGFPAGSALAVGITTGGKPASIGLAPGSGESADVRRLGCIKTSSRGSCIGRIVQYARITFPLAH
jgi:hypothetical protein